jgi:hypothetical protein
MGGFVAPIAQWEYLEPKFNEILSGYGVRVLHAKEFEGTKDAFRRWSKIRKRTLAQELFGAASGRMFGLSVAVPRPEVVDWKRESGRLSQMSPLGICFASIMMKILTDSRTAELAKKDGLAFLVESGNKNNSEIEKYFHKMAKHPTFGGTLKSISFIAKNSCRVIQIADFFAYYSRRYLRARFSGRLSLPMSPYLEIIRKNVLIWHWVGRGAPEILDLSIDDVSNLNELMVSLKDAKPL